MATLYEFDLGGRTYPLAIANRHFYVLNGDTLLPIRVWPAWCEGCGKFTAAEQIFPADEEAQELRELEHFAERPGLIPPDRHVRLEVLPELRVRKKWRAARAAPPKCLVCGSVQITSIWPGPEIDIPGRGNCVGGFRGWADMTRPPDEYYGPEGDRVPSGSK